MTVTRHQSGSLSPCPALVAAASAYWAFCSVIRPTPVCRLGAEGWGGVGQEAGWMGLYSWMCHSQVPSSSPLTAPPSHPSLPQVSAPHTHKLSYTCAYVNTQAPICAPMSVGTYVHMLTECAHTRKDWKGEDPMAGLSSWEGLSS